MFYNFSISVPTFSHFSTFSQNFPHFPTILPHFLTFPTFSTFSYNFTTFLPHCSTFFPHFSTFSHNFLTFSRNFPTCSHISTFLPVANPFFAAVVGRCSPRGRWRAAWVLVVQGIARRRMMRRWRMRALAR